MTALNILDSVNHQYDNTDSGLTAEDVKNALDEIITLLEALEARVTALENA